jgi:sialic acid synthase SpsE
MTNNNFWKLLEAPIFLPDIGTFFNQDIKQAKSIIDQLAASGIKTIKGEVLHDVNICLPSNTQDCYLGVNSQQLIKENYRALIERKVVSLDDYRIIFNYAQQQGLKVIVSVYDKKGADFALEIGCIAIKVATSNITHQPLIEHIAKLGLPMLIDTGGSTLEEIFRAVNWAKDAGNNDLLIEHSPAAPPASIEQHNLNFMVTLANASNLAVGLSDHHYGDEMLYAATALGAKVLEKGVCADNIGDEQDSGHAMKISDVINANQKILNISKALGNGQRNLSRDRVKKTARMGLVAQTDLSQGTILDESNFTYAFPAFGIGTEFSQEVSGLKMNKNIKAGTPITWSDIQG